MLNDELYRRARDEITLRESDDVELKIGLDRLPSQNTAIAKVMIQSYINQLNETDK